MPTYSFKKPDGSVVERVMPMRAAPAVGETLTLEDGTELVRILSVTAHDRLHPGRWPHRSEACGCLPEQIPEMKKRWPHHEFDHKTGDMIFRNPRHMDRCLKDLGGVARKYVP